MEKDKKWFKFLDDNVRYADIINGIGCYGKQVVKASDLTEMDTRTNGKYRDMLQKVAFGVGFSIIGIENQETVDYSMPIRIMDYDVGHYRKQKAKIAKRNRKRFKKKSIDISSLESGEFLYAFCRSDKVYPVVTFVLYTGIEPWKGPTCLHDVIDFTDIPQSIRELVGNYNIHIVDIRRLKDTSIFKTDIKQVFDFIRVTENKKALLDLVDNDSYYNNMDKDAFDVVRLYTNSDTIIKMEDYRFEDGGVNMCKAIQDLMMDSREEGLLEGREIGIKEGIKEGQTVVILNMLKQELSVEKICLFTGCDLDFVNKVKDGITV